MRSFSGLQFHAKDFNNSQLAAGKRVLVVGSGRSALDIASMIAASQQAAQIIWLFRQVGQLQHMRVPQLLHAQYCRITTGRVLQRRRRLATACSAAIYTHFRAAVTTHKPVRPLSYPSPHGQLFAERDSHTWIYFHRHKWCPTHAKTYINRAIDRHQRTGQIYFISFCRMSLRAC